MPDPRHWTGRARRSAWPVVAFFCAVGGWTEPPPQESTTRPAVETLAAARQRLSRTPSRDLSRSDRALLAGLDLALAIGQADGRRVAHLIDVVGYQKLPLAGELPERPDKPVPAEELARWISAGPTLDLGYVTLDQAVVVPRDELRPVFPAVSRWMLPQDLAVVFRPPPVEAAAAGWVGQEACVVVRLRGERASVIGGNLFTALTTGQGPSPPGRSR